MMEIDVEKIDQVLEELQGLRKDVYVLKGMHDVLAATNEQQYLNTSDRLNELILQKKLQNGRVAKNDAAIQVNAIAIAGMKSYTRAWVTIVPLVITATGILLTVFVL